MLARPAIMRHAEEILLPPGTETLPSLKPTWRGRSHRGRLEHLAEEREHVSTHTTFSMRLAPTQLVHNAQCPPVRASYLPSDDPLPLGFLGS